ncbi:MAG: GIY-YIG nuclease family protein [Bacteroidales bacterium]|nr:GIY-YIG nuclease family protein [Bacteroidales bacterium]
MKTYYIYILTNYHKNVLYIGFTSNLIKRLQQHKNHTFKDSFTDKYNVTNCIYYEEFDNPDDAIKREKQLKNWSREKKEELINSNNPNWNTLFDLASTKQQKVTYQQEVQNFLKEYYPNLAKKE